MASQVPNTESTMQYGHMPLQDRRDPNLDATGSTSFHPNGLGQALGSHLTTGVGHGPSYTRPNDYRNPSTSPPTLNQPGSSNHAATSSSHSPLTYVPSTVTSPAMKRKQVEGNMNAQPPKRRREPAGGEDGEGFDLEGGAQGAKHWSDDEKSKLFTWLMGPGQDEHWNALRATKNSCLRDCATEVFGGKKTYQALKGCYERNFNLFKQIYAFETAHGQGGGTSNIAQLSEADRLREYERRLQIARKAGSDVGNISARTIDHWHRVGWYDLFYRRWHGDPATTRPAAQGRSTGIGNSTTVNADEPEDEDPTLDFNDHSSHLNGLNGLTHERQQPPQQQQQQQVYINPQDLRENPAPPPPPPPISQASSAAGLRSAPSQHPPHTSHPLHQSHSTQSQPQQPPPPKPNHQPQPPPPQPSLHTPLGIPMPNLQSDTPGIAFPLPPDLIGACLQYLNMQSKVAQEKLEYLRRKEAREISEITSKQEMANKQNKTEKAIELINNPNTDANLKQVANEYLRKIFLPD